jgi:hypothetical protein
VPAILRKFYRTIYPDARRPVSDAAGRELIERVNQPAQGQPADSGLTDIMVFIHQSRPDLQEAFNLGSPDGRTGYRNWFSVGAQREYGLGPAFTELNNNGANAQSAAKKWLGRLTNR